MNETYNGWTNYETWLVDLWIDNDSGIYEEVHGELKDESKTAYDLAEKIEELVEDEAFESNNSGMVCDLLHSAISRVNFEEIAENIMAA